MNPAKHEHIPLAHKELEKLRYVVMLHILPELEAVGVEVEINGFNLCVLIDSSFWSDAIHL